MNKEEKALQYIDKKKVFPLKNTKNSIWYGIEGHTGVWQVKYNKLKDEYSCNCPNVRLVDCTHIIAIKKYRDKNE